MITILALFRFNCSEHVSFPDFLACIANRFSYYFFSSEKRTINNFQTEIWIIRQHVKNRYSSNNFKPNFRSLRMILGRILLFGSLIFFSNKQINGKLTIE